MVKLVDYIDTVRKNHYYWSTHCRHERHAECKARTLNGLPRKPAQCKTCGSPCICWCHEPGQE